jgi:serine/threonine-protein kinase
MPPDTPGVGETRHGASPFDGSVERPLLDRIGSYRILRVLGEGGMGVVYLAVQDEPVRREVALKVLRAGAYSREIVARFESERQALALMEHPNITKVFDAGVTEAGLPYFVMERVAGVPITEYAAAKRLTTRERVQLFTQVCRAVQHAHQKGIIHRDVKPSNVLVTETDGAPLCKVIDFGIAKATAPTPVSARLTATGMVVGTPAYMSPEQFISDGTDIDTRSDIYSLGMLLYELVAGVLPFNPDSHSGRGALMAQHSTESVPAPSTQYAALDATTRTAVAAERRTDPDSLRRTLRGDLDSVILKALERDREHRYATANGLAQDLEHYLADKPVSARPTSPAYRARKFAVRHRGSVAFAGTVLLLLVAFAAIMTVQAQRLARARATAVARQGQAEELIGFMLGDLRNRLEPIGRLDLLDDVGTRALRYFAVVPESELSDEELYTRSVALSQLGQVRTSQGKLPAAAELLSQALALAAPLAARDSMNPRWQLALAHIHFWAGNVDWLQGNVDAALRHFEPFVRISERLIAIYPDSLSYRAERAYALNNIGFAKEGKGDARGALQFYLASLAIDEDLVQRDPTKVDWQVGVALERNAAAVAQRKIGELTNALANHRAELAVKEALVKRDSANREWHRYLAIAHAYLGELQLWMGDVDGALGDARAARTIYAALVARDSSNAAWRISLAKSERQLAQALLERGDAPGALRELDIGQPIAERLVAASPENPRVAAELAITQTTRGRALLRAGRPTEALVPVRQGLAIGEAAMARKPSDIERRRQTADSYVALGEILSRSGDASGATAAWSRALTLVDSLARTARETELLAVQAAALLRLDRIDDARPVVAELLRRAYRRPSFVELVRAKGIVDVP